MRKAMGGGERRIDGHTVRSTRWVAHTALMTAVIAFAATPMVSRGDVNSPIGYLRTVDGTAAILSAHGERPAEPFSALRSGDTLTVGSGTVVVCDMRTGESFEVRAGNTLSLPDTVARPNRPLYERLRAALSALTTVPEQTGPARVRGKARSAWPDQLWLAPHAAVQFRWSSGAAAGSFELRRLEPRPELVAHSDHPLSPWPWPGAVPRTPGRYLWEVHDASGGRLASGQFTLMTEVEAHTQRERYIAQAAAQFDAPQRALLAELLAARDGYVLD
jgi:hypothetical protein